jgi:hypothetical protein
MYATTEEKLKLQVGHNPNFTEPSLVMIAGENPILRQHLRREH